MCDRCATHPRLREYLSKFYDYGYTVIDHNGKQNWNPTEPDVILHPMDHKSINIVGRDH